MEQFNLQFLYCSNTNEQQFLGHMHSLGDHLGSRAKVEN